MYKEMPAISSSYRDQVTAKKLQDLIVEIVRNELNDSLNRMRG
jgi:hypothetical protein